MFHLEDYLEKLEPLPQEMKNHFAELGETDLQVEQCMEAVKNNFDNLFSIADELNPDDLEQNFNVIMKKGKEALEKSDNKIKIANSMQELLKKYMNKLDHDLHNFQVELDEKYGSVTEQIEKRVLGSKESHETSQKENKNKLNKYLFGGKSIHQPSSNEEINVISDTSPENSMMGLFLQKHKKTSLNTPCKKMKSYKKLRTSQPSNIPSSNVSVVNSDKKNQSSPSTKNKMPKIKLKTNEDNKNNSKELRYCFCNEVAYDKMVACDNELCPYEWFHFECVGITHQLPGQWYCSWCTNRMKIKD